MTRTTSARWIFQRRRWLEALFSLSLLGLFASPGEASPIRQHRITARGARDLRMWTSYLAGGSGLWSQAKAPHISAAVHRAMVSALRSADPRSTPWVQYLLWRQGRNIARFNFYHPVLGPSSRTSRHRPRRPRIHRRVGKLFRRQSAMPATTPSRVRFSSRSACSAQGSGGDPARAVRQLGLRRPERLFGLGD